MEAGEDNYREENLGNVNSRRPAPDLARLTELVTRLAAADKPLIVAGKGVVISRAWAELTALAEALSIPVATSLGGKGAIDEMHDLAVGVIGRNSRKVGNDAVRAAGSILAIGTRLGGLATHRWTLPFGEKPLFHIDIDADILGHNFPTEIGVAGDARATLAAALEIVKAKSLSRPRTPWARDTGARVETWRKHAANMRVDQPVEGIHPAEVIAACRAEMKPDDIIGADTGAHGGWVGALFPVAAGQTMIRANGSLGWVVPGAFGASIAAPDRRVVAVTGDGGLMYHIAEFETALRCRMPAVIVVLNNSCLASERHTQQKHQRVVNSVIDFRDTDFAAVARAFGAHGVRVEKSGDLRAAIRGALDCGGPALVDVVVSRDAQSPSANNDKTRLV